MNNNFFGSMAYVMIPNAVLRVGNIYIYLARIYIHEKGKHDYYT